MYKQTQLIQTNHRRRQSYNIEKEGIHTRSGSSKGGLGNVLSPANGRRKGIVGTYNKG